MRGPAGPGLDGAQGELVDRPSDGPSRAEPMGHGDTSKGRLGVVKSPDGFLGLCVPRGLVEIETSFPETLILKKSGG